MSAYTGKGLPELKAMLDEFRTTMNQFGELSRVRREQHRTWMWSYIEDNILELFKQHPRVAAVLPDLSKRVQEGLLAPGAAAEILLAEFSGKG